MKRLAFIGAGNMGQCAHLRNYADIRECEVVAIAELREGLGKKVAQRYGIPQSFTHHTELLEKAEFDALVAIQPFQLHKDLLPDLYATGKPVLTEKPLADSVEAGQGLLAALKKSGGKHYLGYHKRSDPATIAAVAEARAWEESGDYGPLQYIRMTMPPGDWVQNGFYGVVQTEEPYPELFKKDDLPEDQKKAREKYLAFVNYYIHQVNLLRHLLGEDYRVSYADPKEKIIVFHSDSGVPCVLEMATYYNHVEWQESAQICFAKGWIHLELPAPLARARAGKVRLYKDPGGGVVPQEIIPALPWQDAMRQQAVHFVQELNGETTPLCQAEEAQKDLEIARDYIELLAQMG